MGILGSSQLQQSLSWLQGATSSRPSGADPTEAERKVEGAWVWGWDSFVEDEEVGA